MGASADNPAGHRDPAWFERRERSNTLAIRFIVWVALSLGRPAARLLLYPICLYFLLFSARARAASRNYLGRVLGRAARFTDLFRHYHTFAATILDRVFLLNDQYSRFDVTVHGEEIVGDMIHRREGCILLGAHLGSFEIVRSLGREARGLDVSLVMYEENARKLNSVLALINPNLPLQIIGLGKVDAMLKVGEALAAGRFVGLLSDRTIEGEGTVPCEFLGGKSFFPTGPFRLAAMLNQPVVLMLGIYRGGNRYEIHFEKLAVVAQTTRGGRNQIIEQAVQHYADRLAHYCRLAPYNWFNFYDFWT